MAQVYDWDELKLVLNDVNADPRTRKVARGLAKISIKVAIEYAEKLPLRRLAEQPVRKDYE